MRKKTRRPLNLSMKNDTYMRAASIMLKEQSKKRSVPVSNKEFLSESIDIRDMRFFPSANLGILLGTIFIPYTVGFTFMFLLITLGGIGNPLYLFERHSFLMMWAIGYELIAFRFIFWVMKIMISNSLRRSRLE